MAIQKSLKNSPNGLYGDISIDGILRCWKCGFGFCVEWGDDVSELKDAKCESGRRGHK